MRVLEEETGKYRRLKLLRYLGSDRRSLEVQAELDPAAGAAQEKPFRLELGGPQIYVASDVVWGCPPVEDGAEDLRVDAAAMETDPDRLAPLVLFVPLEPDDDGGLGGDGEQLAQYLDSGDHAFIDPARTRPFVAHMWRRITRAPMRKAVAAAVEHVRALWSPPRSSAARRPSSASGSRCTGPTTTLGTRARSSRMTARRGSIR